jgi:hypothetical protein
VQRRVARAVLGVDIGAATKETLHLLEIAL